MLPIQEAKAQDCSYCSQQALQKWKTGEEKVLIDEEEEAAENNVPPEKLSGGQEVANQGVGSGDEQGDQDQTGTLYTDNSTPAHYANNNARSSAAISYQTAFAPNNSSDNSTVINVKDGVLSCKFESNKSAQQNFIKASYKVPEPTQPAAKKSTNFGDAILTTVSELAKPIEGIRNNLLGTPVAFPVQMRTALTRKGAEETGIAQGTRVPPGHVDALVAPLKQGRKGFLDKYNKALDERKPEKISARKKPTKKLGQEDPEKQNEDKKKPVCQEDATWEGKCP